MEKKIQYKFLGFDMDFTLLKYGPIPRFHRFIFDCFSRSIVEECGWSELYREITDEELKIGLHFITIDYDNGMLLKISQHKEIMKAFIGFREVKEEELMEIYG